jgi:hypothetical protein
METKLVAITVEELQHLMQSTIRQEIQAALQMPVTGAGIQEELWDRKKAASFLVISEQTLIKLVLEGKIIAQRSGRKYHFLKSNILNFLRATYKS